LTPLRRKLPLRIKVIIENYPEKQVETLKAPIHPQNEDRGKRDIFFSQEL
jgi:glutaminyl-tRNA synthetase